MLAAQTENMEVEWQHSDSTVARLSPGCLAALEAARWRLEGAAGHQGNRQQGQPGVGAMKQSGHLSNITADVSLSAAAPRPASPATLALQAKTTKKIVLRLACTVCKAQHMHAIKVRQHCCPPASNALGLQPPSA